MASVEAQEHSIKSQSDNAGTTVVSGKSKEKSLSTCDEQDESNDTCTVVDKKKTAAGATDNIKNAEKPPNCDNTEIENKEEVTVVKLGTHQNNHNVDKVEDVQNVEKSDTVSSIPENDSKIPNNDSSKESPIKVGNNLKRKRRSIITPETDTLLEENSTRSKRKKIKSTSDRFCWRCHKESVEAHCSACPRSWHRRCIGGMQPTSIQNWICGECATILRAENAETRSMAMAQLSVDQLCLLLRHVVERMRDYPGSEPFGKPVELSEAPNYLDYVVKPMDLNLLESNVKAKLYGSTDAFMADAKWIQHNCIVFNTCGGVYTDTSKLSNAAKQIIKMARQEVSEIEACPDCYAHGRNLPRPQPSWFIEPCRRPHPLVWAKLKGFPFWPAKAMPRVNSQGYVDVRFFGEHDRAWVSPRDLYLYSEDPPAPLPRKRKLDMDECVREITRHCRKLELVFGQFKFAPPKVQYNPNDPMQIKLMLPNYDPLHPNNCITSQFLAPKKRTLPKKRASLIRVKSQIDLQKTENSDNESRPQVSDANTSIDTEQSETESKLLKVQKTENSDEVTVISNSCNDLNDKVNIDEPKKEEVQEDTVHSERKLSDTVIKTEAVEPGPSKVNETKNASVTQRVHTTHVTKIELNDTVEEAEKPKLSENSTTQLISPVQNSLENVQLPKKESLLKSNVLKSDSWQNASNMQKPGSKTPKTVAKVYKPKTRMVDKVNAERALKSITANEQNQKSNTEDSKATPAHSESMQLKDTLKNSDSSSMSPSLLISNAKPQTDFSAASSPIIHSSVKPTDQSVALFLLVNSGSPDTIKQPISLIEKEKGTDIPGLVQHVPKDMPVTPHSKKESKARKSFPNKPRSHSQPLSHSSPNSSSNSLDRMVYVPVNQAENCVGYQLLPPEAGPISTRLYHGAHDLARKMAQLMEEAYKEAAQENQTHENGTSENHQATVHFLRLQIERMRWQHQQQLAELKHNTDRILREMRASLEAERLRAIEETRREAEEEKIRCIEEIKRKQWCAMCGREALFYCCWNTAYCDYPCQQSHWPTHMRTCAQQPSFNSIVTSSAASSNQQQNHNAKVNSPAGRVCALSHSKLSEISASLSLSYSRNEGNQESS